MFLHESRKDVLRDVRETDRIESEVLRGRLARFQYGIARVALVDAFAKNAGQTWAPFGRSAKPSRRGQTTSF